MESERPKGKTFGVYEVLEELGRGGMGVVYKAHEESLGRDVALKILPARLAAHESVVARFQREARASASLSHPSITPVYAVGEHKGTHFIAMEFVRGPTLHQIIKGNGPIEIGEALRIVKEVADALREAHRHGILHRDVKPANIMFDHRRRVKVMDFGLARVSSETSQITGEGARLGTPAYMSPEQCEGKPLDVRSDIYSLGVTLYQMLTNQTPFPGDDPRSVMFNITSGTFPNIEEKRPDLSQGVCQLLRNMVARDAVHRYESVRNLIADVDHLQRDTNHPVGVPGTGSFGFADEKPFVEPKRISPKTSGVPETRHDRSNRVPLRWSIGGISLITFIVTAVAAYVVILGPTAPIAEPLPSTEGRVNPELPPPIAGLVAHWSFDEGHGVIAKDAIGGHDGVLHSAVWTKGVQGTGLQLTGDKSSYVEVLHSEALSPTNGVTVTAWINIFDLPRRFSSIVFKSAADPITTYSERTYTLWVYQDETAEVGVHFASTPAGAATQAYDSSDGNEIGFQEFFHIAGVVDAGQEQMSMYVNGRRVALSAYPGNAIRGGNGPLRIGGIYNIDGSRQTTAGGFVGVLDEVRIYDRALSAVELQSEISAVRNDPTTEGEATFADSIAGYEPGPGVRSLNEDPNKALGSPDSDGDDRNFVSLGERGSVTLSFVDNALVPSGDPGVDLWVYGLATAHIREPVVVQIRRGEGPWIDVGPAKKSLPGIDIDAYINRGVEPTASYDQVRLIDRSKRSRIPRSGASIDAVAAIRSTQAVAPTI